MNKFDELPIGDLLEMGYRKFTIKRSQSILQVDDDCYNAIIIEWTGREVPIQLNATWHTGYTPTDDEIQRRRRGE